MDSYSWMVNVPPQRPCLGSMYTAKCPHRPPWMGYIQRKHWIKETGISILAEEVTSFCFRSYKQNHTIYKNERAKEVKLTSSSLSLILRSPSHISFVNNLISWASVFWPAKWKWQYPSDYSQEDWMAYNSHCRELTPGLGMRLPGFSSLWFSIISSWLYKPAV